MARTRGKTRRYGKTTPAASRRPPAPLDSHVRSFMVMGPAPPVSIRTRSDRRSGRRVRQLAWRERPSLLLQFVVPRSHRVHCCQIRFRRSFVSPRIPSRIRCLLWIPASSVVFSRVFPRHKQAAPRCRRGSFTPSDPSLQRSLRYPSLPWTACVSESGRRCWYVCTNLTLECLIARVNLLLDRLRELTA